jgi:hypothetical protein
MFGMRRIIIIITELIAVSYAVVCRRKRIDFRIFHHDIVAKTINVGQIGRGSRPFRMRHFRQIFANCVFDEGGEH